LAMRLEIVERRLKERLIGASVIVILAVIFIPMILDNSGQYDSEISGTNIPDRPEGDFSSRIVPIEQNASTLTSESATESMIDSDPAIIEKVISEQPNDVLNTPEEQIESEEVEANESIAPVIVEKASGPSTPRSSEVGITAWVVQLGSFEKEENADKLNKSLREMGFTAFVEPINQANEVIYRVRVGPELLRSDAIELQKVLNEKIQIQGLVIKYP
jgi:DedD protein